MYSFFTDTIINKKSWWKKIEVNFLKSAIAFKE